jgi:hypothetical protein
MDKLPELSIEGSENFGTAHSYLVPDESLQQTPEAPDAQHQDAQVAQNILSDPTASSSDDVDAYLDELEYNVFIAGFNAATQLEPRSSNALEYPEDSVNEPRSSDYWTKVAESVRNSRFSDRRFNRSSLIAPRSSDYIDSQVARTSTVEHVTVEDQLRSSLAMRSEHYQAPYITRKERFEPEAMNSPTYDRWRSEQASIHVAGLRKDRVRRQNKEVILFLSKTVSQALETIPRVERELTEFEQLRGQLTDTVVMMLANAREECQFLSAKARRTQEDISHVIQIGSLDTIPSTLQGHVAVLKWSLYTLERRLRDFAEPRYRPGDDKPADKLADVCIAMLRPLSKSCNELGRRTQGITKDEIWPEAPIRQSDLALVKSKEHSEDL